MADICLTFVGGLIGIAGTIFGGFLQRSYSEWRSFQQEIGLIRDKIERASDRDISGSYRSSIEAVVQAVYRFRPYIFHSDTREKLVALLNEYREAVNNPESGLQGFPKDPAQPVGGWFPDPAKTRIYIPNLLKSMENISYWKS